MMEYVLKRDDVAYYAPMDMLYAVYNDGDLSICDELEDIWGRGITVMKTDGELSGIEIYDFKGTYGEPPLVIDVPAREPFKLEIPFAI